MKIRFDEGAFDKCILCVENAADSWEHIIPESVGGRIELKILCTKCNTGLCSGLVAGLTADPSIRLAIESLQSSLPHLYERMTKRKIFTGRSSDGKSLDIVRKGGDWRVLPRREDDGSITKPKGDARKELRNQLEQLRLPFQEIQALLGKFDSLEVDKPVAFRGGLILVNRSADNIHPQFSGDMVDPRLPALIAFEFAALYAGRDIYSSIFDDMRSYILHAKESDRYFVERMRAKNQSYASHHTIDIQIERTKFIICIRFFRTLVFVTTFDGFDAQIPEAVWIEDLEKKRTLFAVSQVEAEQDGWYVI